jgi:putative RecB family exonuclease
VLTAPNSISPSSASTYRQCPKRYQYSAIDRIHQPATVATAKGTMVHRALELLFLEIPRSERSRSHASAMLQRAADEHEEGGTFAEIAEFPGREAMVRLGEASLSGYFRLEDPTLPNTIMTEQRISETVGEVTVLGIIDRVDQLDDGSLIVIDYKTGKMPEARFLDKEFTALRTYAALLGRELGQVPVALWLYYLNAGATAPRRCTAEIAHDAHVRILETYDDIVADCESGDFEARRSTLCNWCAFQDLCPGEAPLHLKGTRRRR